VILGTGTPNADPDRSGPAVAVVVGDTPYLVDCGPGVVRRAAAAKRNGVEALRVENLNHLFITHLHSDHTVGLPDLIFTPWVLGREKPLKVFGPPGTKNMVEHILAAYTEDIAIRRNGLEGANANGYKVDVVEIDLGPSANEGAPRSLFRSTTVLTEDGVTVKAFPVKHGSWKHAYGFRFETPDRVIVISGDTGPSESLVANARGCDVLLHEVYSVQGFETRPPEWQRYHASFHTSTTQLADIASQVRPKLLVLYHQLYWGMTDDDLLKEMAPHYPGRVVSAADLDVY